MMQIWLLEDSESILMVKLFKKSYSPYLDDLKSAYPDETFETANPLNVPDYVWDHILEHAL